MGEERFGWKSSPPPDPASFSDECLHAAEEAAQQVLNCIHPTLDSEEKRRDVIDYVHRLIKTHLNCEVFPYGSVPLRTYLPDGDIDFTALKGPNVEESLAHGVVAVLQGEEHNENAEFQVKDTQFIDAEVKLVKCLIRNIVIDISFNQLGGLSTLCFLEQVDRLIGRNHLFKRSIILVKAWCYYESRILGAHHGLISTYALETLILYIFNLFHSSLSGPLAVLCRFLDYYCQFDWENYCISLKGPVCKTSLPCVVGKMPETGWNNLMLKEEFLENCIEMFSVPSRGLEENPRAFQTKHLNIIDPLKENNNLGRSVNRGNFYRIRSAFKYGARKLGQILLQPREKVADEVRKFFTNTLERHGHTSSIQRLSVEFGDEESLSASMSTPTEWFSEDDILVKSSVSYFDNDYVGTEEKSTSLFKNELDRYSMREVSLEMTSNSSLRNGASDYTPSSNYSTSLFGNHCCKSFYISSKSSAENGSLDSWLEDRDKHGEMNRNTYQWCMDNSQSGSSTPTDNNLSLDCKEIDLTSVGVESEAFNPLADLTGDYDSHIRSLLYGQLCHGFSLSASQVYNPPSLPSSKKPWDIFRRSMSFWQTQLSQVKSEGTQKARGTGTYFPHVNVFYRNRNSQWRGRNKAPGNLNHFYRHSNGNENVASNDYLSGSCRIEFGSIGNLAEEVISGSAHGTSLETQGTTPLPKQQRYQSNEFLDHDMS